MDEQTSPAAAGVTIDNMALPDTLLALAGLLDDLERRRLARALHTPAPDLDDDDAYDVLVRAAADLDDHAATLLTALSTPAPA